MNKKNTLIISLCVIILSSLLFACSGKKVNANEYEKVPLSASWEYNYESVEEMAHSCDIIAIVKITGSDIDNSYSAYNVLLTVYNAEVKQLIYGKSEDKIKIVMTGGIDEAAKKIYEVADDPLMNKDDEFLIFAQQNEDGTYTILSGSQGRFQIVNGKVYSLNISNQQVQAYNSGSNIRIDGEDKDEFISKVKAYAENK